MFPNPLDAVIDPLCKTDESRKLAKAYFKLIRSLRPGEGTNNLPPGIAFICAWIANVRVGQKTGISLGTIQKQSTIASTPFLDSLSSIQEMLLKAEQLVKQVKSKDPGDATSFKYECLPLPAYSSACQNCANKHHHCLKSSYTNAKRCVSCNMRKVPCSMEGNNKGVERHSDPPSLDDDSDNQPLAKKSPQKLHSRRMKEGGPARCPSDRSLHASTSAVTEPVAKLLPSSAAKIPERLKLSSASSSPALISNPPSRLATPAFTFGLPIIEEDVKPTIRRSPATPTFSKLKRPAQEYPHTPITTKKPRMEGIEPERPPPSGMNMQQARRSNHSTQLATPTSPTRKRSFPQPLVRSETQKELSPLPIPARLQPKLSRHSSYIPSPSPSDAGRAPSSDSRLGISTSSLPSSPLILRLPILPIEPSYDSKPIRNTPPVAPPTPSATPMPDHDPFDAHAALGRAIRQAATAVTNYVRAHSCDDFQLRLKVLDLHTRLDELDRLADVRCMVGERAAEEAVVEELAADAERAVVDHVGEHGCVDVRLKMKIRDLGTRLDMEKCV